jgi:ribosomal protein S18 acetylase RimI-like enzyme
MPELLIRRLSPADASAYRRLRLLALKESPTAFGSSYGEEVNLPLTVFTRKLKIASTNWVFGAFEGERLIGILRLVREDGKKESHKAAIYGMYVSSKERRKGVASLLLKAAITKASSWSSFRQIRLAVTESNTAAALLYRKAGFSEFGIEKDSLRIGGKYYSESLMVLKF